MPAQTAKVGTSNIPGTAKFIDNGAGSQGIYMYVFDATAEEELYFMVQLPHNWKLGTSLHPHVHWSPMTSGTTGQKVSWGLEYSKAEIASVFPVSTIIYGDTTTSVVAKTHNMTSLDAISFSGIDSVSAMLVCRIFRNATGGN